MMLSIQKMIGYGWTGAALLIACHPSPVPPLPPDHVALQTGSSLQVSTGLTITADSVSVSICPANASCFAPNSATVLLRLSTGTQSQSTRLWAWIPNYTRRSVHPPGFTDSTSIDLGGQRYKVILRDGTYTSDPGSERQPKGIAIVQVSPM